MRPAAVDRINEVRVEVVTLTCLLRNFSTQNFEIALVSRKFGESYCQVALKSFSAVANSASRSLSIAFFVRIEASTLSFRV